MIRIMKCPYCGERETIETKNRTAWLSLYNCRHFMGVGQHRKVWVVLYAKNKETKIIRLMELKEVK